MSSFSVKPVKEYVAGYPKKGFFRKSFVAALPIKLFSLLVVGMLFFITVPGCFEQETRTDGVPVVDFDMVTDNETSDHDELLGLPDFEETDIDTTDSEPIDFEPNDFDQIDGGAVPECLEDKDCDEGYYCDLSSYTCEIELAGEAVPECMTDEECEEGYYCDLSSYTCVVEEMSGVDEPEIIPDEDSDVNDEEIPDEELSGFAPPVLKK
ncbi:MAG TPA: dickkopf-related protein [bacterium]|nr:dickkopf-related protein [bacterium]